MKRLLIAAAIICLGWLSLLSSAGPAAAHAELRASDPIAGERLARAPQALLLEFTEGVALVQDGIRLLDADGARVPMGTPRAMGAAVVVPVRGMSEGGYVLVWRVLSADSHPVAGSLPFAVGDAALPDVQAGPGGGGDAAGAVMAVLRWAGYVGTALLIGSAVFVAACWPTGADRPGIRRAALSGGSLTAGAALVGLLVQGPYAAGRSLLDLLDPTLLGATLDSPYGMAGMARAGAVGLLTAWAIATLHRRRLSSAARRAGTLAVIMTVGVVLGATFGMQGHAWAATPRALAVLVDAVHVLAMSVWLGGLAVLVTIALRPVTAALPSPALTDYAPASATVAARRTSGTAYAADRSFPGEPRPGPDSERGGDVSPDLRRWSWMAMASVIVLALTGTVAGIREVGGWSALTGSDYGRLLMTKLALVAVLLTVASRARAWVQRHTASGRDPIDAAAIRRLRGSVVVEAALAAAVLAVTAVLVAITPATSVAGGDAVRAGLPDGTVAVVDAEHRLLEVHVETRHGRAVRPAEVTAVASLPSRDIDRLRVPLHPSESKEVWAAHDPLPFPGLWRVTVTVRTSEIDSGVTSVTLPIP